MISNNQLFNCTQCGQCCKGYGGTNLSPACLANIAEYLGLDPSEFESRFCVQSGNKLVLKQREDGFCIFLNRNCSIHRVKPEMCKNWPFIGSLLVDIGNWQAMANSCPGMKNPINTKDIEKIREILRFRSNKSPVRCGNK
ncbi:MAG: YkgJ family cysteine cluster protein [Desulfobacteraceae bacterium]|nr:YkgJ family cysteine cluster protein [Desulfobacteraceae bacterium]